MLTALAGYCKCLSLVYVQDGLRLASLAGNPQYMQDDADVVALEIQLIVGSGTKDGVNTIIADLSDVARPTFVSYVDYLNTTFRSAHNLAGIFTIVRGLDIYYSNPERFVAGELLWDLGGFGSGFGPGFN